MDKTLMILGLGGVGTHAAHLAGRLPGVRVAVGDIRADHARQVANSLIAESYFFSTRESCGSKGLSGRYAGLGLTVARSLAHGRGYELTAVNGADGGAVFTLLLPLGTDGISI